MKKLTEQQELYLTMVDEDTSEIINQLKVRKDTKTNIKLVYGFMKDVSNRFDYTKLQSTGRLSNMYKLRQTSCDKPFIASYRTISSQVGISNNSVGIYVQHLENLGVIEVIKDTPINEVAINDNTSCDTNTISNTISNTILDNISNLDYNIYKNKTELNNINFDLLYKSLIKENKQMVEQIQELKEQIVKYASLTDELIEKVNKLEDAVIALQDNGNKQTDEITNIKQSKSNINSFWDSWNRFKDALYHGNVENKEQHYKTYINKVKELYKDPTKALQQMEEQYIKATSNKSNQSNSNFVVKDDLNVYMDLRNNASITNALTQWLQQVNQKLTEIPTEHREQAKTYYINYMFKVLPDRPKDALIKHWNKNIPNFQIN